ncbi:TMV resistance protein N [Vigna radiata var. radiata]|uniref:TMV resistance protein N n=1 Tax=Vigna radiata var. radiata TaxID=3916 RepID=A0A1S3VQ26_VIGRR|nr:TMV resistance protein N [Vigna radiata var. radiata]
MYSSFSSSSNTKPEKHEVFISFKSEDTRKTFTSHLNGALKRRDIETYTECKVERGEEMPLTHVRAIEESKLSLIVFSKNYADSRCLDELVKIVECGKRKRHIVLPVFYDIDPSDVRNQRGTFAEAFAKHEKHFEEKKKVREWRNALVEAANFSGWDCNDVNRTEFEMVEEIANDVLEKLNRANVIDLDVQIAKLEQLAQLQHDLYTRIITVENLEKHTATVQRVIELKMERSIRLLRLTPDMLSYTQKSNSGYAYGF